MGGIVIEGGRPLRGTVKISGAKNSALPILAAALLTKEASVIKNVPFRLRDVHTMVRILRSLGAKVRMGDDRIEVKPGNSIKCTAPYSLFSTMRASICVLGPLLAHLGMAQVSLPGGCVIGPRPIGCGRRERRPKAFGRSYGRGLCHEQRMALGDHCAARGSVDRRHS